ncbi:MAG: NAD(P)H-quinone oxidoreductase [Pyrinomonadaceae bacterium]
MKAVYINDFGSIDGLGLREVEMPASPSPSQVLVRVHAAGINRADLLQARGLYPPPSGYSPNIPGLEFAGEIVEAGSDVTAFAAGARVFGITAGEAQAEYLLTDAAIVTEIPDNLSYTEAACVPEAFITAHDAIVTLGGLSAGENLLIHAAGSGVGLAALQVAKAEKARVVATSRTPGKLERCREFGTDASIAVTEPNAFADQVFALTEGRGADVILDLVGGAYFGQNLASLAPKGRLILVGLTSGRTAEIDMGIVLRKRATIIGTVLRARSTEEKAAATQKFADDLIPLFAAGTIKPNLDRVLAAENVVDAYRYLASNRSFGKVVLAFSGTQT